MRRRVIAADVLDSRRNDWTITDDAVGYLNPPGVLSLNAGTPATWQKAKRTRARDDLAFGDDGIDRGPTYSWPAPILQPSRPSDDRNPATYEAKARLTRSGLPDAYDFLRGKLDRPKLKFEDFPDEDTYPEVATSDAMGMSTFSSAPQGSRTEPLRPPDGIQQYRYVRRPLVSFEYDIPGVDRYQHADFAGLVHFMRRTDAGALDAWGGYTGQECRGLYSSLSLDDAGMPKSWYEVIDRARDQIIAKLSAWGRLLPGDKKTLEESFGNLIAHATDSEKWNRFNATKALSFKLLDSVDSPIVSGGATATQAVSKMMMAFGTKPKADVGPIAAIVRAPMSPSHGAHVAEFEAIWKNLEAHVNAQGGLLSDIGKGIVSVGKGIASPVAALVTSPIKLASDIATGKNVFESLKDTVKRDLSSAKDLAPYVQAAISVIPGVGQGVNAAIAAGAALAQGQPITSALINGLKGALPGGPIASSAFDTAYAVARGENVSEAALQALVNNAPGGAVGKQAAQAAIAVAKGQNIQQAAIGAAKGAALSLIPGAAPAIVKDLATNVVEGQNVLSAATSAVGKQAMASFSPIAKGVLDNTGPARVGTVLSQSLPSILPTDARMAAQALLQNPQLRSLPIEEVARRLGVSTHVARDGMGAVLQAVQRSGGASVPSLSTAKDLASRIPMGMSFDRAMSTFGSRAAPKAYSHNVASHAARASRLRRAGSVFYALGARGIDCGALDPTKMPTIRQGSTGDAVVQWQKILAVTADGKFGPNTHAATVAFQKKNGLAADGIVGPNTWKAGLVTVITTAPPQTVPGTSIPISVPPPTTTAPIIAATMPTIREGSRGAPVVTWQNFLQLKADGIFGPQTKAATISFQTKNALVADGIVGPKTWEKAMSGTSVPTSPPGAPTGPIVVSTPPISIPTPTGPISIPGTTFPIPTPTGPISIPTPTGPIVVSPPTPMPPNPPGQPPPPPPITTSPPGAPPVVLPPPPGTPGSKSSSGLLIAGAVVLGGLLLMGSGSSRKLI